MQDYGNKKELGQSTCYKVKKTVHRSVVGLKEHQKCDIQAKELDSFWQEIKILVN